MPWVRLHLFQAQRNAPLLRIDLENSGFDLLPHRKHVRGFRNTAPGDIADVQQSVHSANIDKRSVIGKTADRAMHRLAFFDLGVPALFPDALLDRKSTRL